MGMFYVCYMGPSKTDFSQTKKFVLQSIPQSAEDIKSGQPHIHLDDPDKFSVWCDFFTLIVRNEGQNTKFRSEDYRMNFKYQFTFDVYTTTPNWMKNMLSFIGKMMNRYDGDFVFESNGDTPIIIRKDNKVIVDDKNLHGIERFPFHELGIDYEEGDIDIPC
jgi:hypothetical protein